MTLANSINDYIHAKDGNRPHLIWAAFAPIATVALDVRTDAISFPDQLTGCDAIAQALVRGFAQNFENVYTFCLTNAPAAQTQVFRCDWLVAMTEKDSGQVRVGCGRYDWQLQSDGERIESLVITIDQMQKLPAEQADTVLGWVAKLPYPWCSSARLRRDAPALAAIKPVLDAIS